MTLLRLSLFIPFAAIGLAPSTATSQPRSSGSGDAIERISIDDLITITVRLAPNLARARADVKIARGEARAARGIDDWEINTSFNASRTTRQPVAGQPVQTTAEEQYRGEAGLRRNLPTGGELTVSVLASRRKEEFRAEDAMNTGVVDRTSSSRVTRARAQFGLRHSLLAGLGREVARVRRSSLESAVELRKLTQNMVRIGKRPPSDLKEAEYSVLVHEESLLAAQIALEEQALRLRRMAGMEIGPRDIMLLPVDLPKVNERRFPVAKMVKRSLRQNPRLAALKLDGKGATIGVRVAQNGRRPRLEFTLSGGLGSTGRNVDGAIRALGDQPQYDISAGLAFSYDVGGNRGRGNYAAALGRARIARIGIEEFRRQIASATVLAVHRTRASKKRVEVTAKAIELAIANLRAERTRFKTGLVSSRELYQRQNEIDDARISRARALADHHQSVAALLALSGDLLRSFRVEVIK